MKKTLSHWSQSRPAPRIVGRTSRLGLRLSLLAVLAVVVSASGIVSEAIAQGQQPAAAASSSAGNRIALLDVSNIFKNHIRFKGWMEDMKQDVKNAELRVRSEREEINKMVEELQQFNIGTPNYKSLEEQIAQRQADMAVKIKLQKNEFLQREAKIYYNVYQEIWQATNYICRQNSIDMVIRFNGDQIDPEMPDSVLTAINRPVVWYNPGLDITNFVLDELNRTAVTPAAAADRRGTAAPRQGVPFNPTR